MSDSSRTPALVAIFIVAVAFVAIAVTSGVPTNQVLVYSNEPVFREPKDLEDLVISGQSIFIASVGTLTEQGYFEGYDSSGNMITPAPTPTGSPGIGTPTPRPASAREYADFDLSVEQTLYDDGTASEFVLRWVGDPNDTDNPYYPAPSSNERFMFFNGTNPGDDTVAPFYGPFGRIILDGTEITYSDGDNTAVPFAAGMTESEFIQAVNDVLDDLE